MQVMFLCPRETKVSLQYRPHSFNICYHCYLSSIYVLRKKYCQLNYDTMLSITSIFKIHTNFGDVKMKKMDKTDMCMKPINRTSDVICPIHATVSIKWTVILEAFCFTTIIIMWILKVLKAQNLWQLFSHVLDGHNLMLSIWLLLLFHSASMSPFIYFESNILSMRISFKIIATLYASHK